MHCGGTENQIQPHLSSVYTSLRALITSLQSADVDFGALRVAAINAASGALAGVRHPSTAVTITAATAQQRHSPPSPSAIAPSAAPSDASVAATRAGAAGAPSFGVFGPITQSTLLLALGLEARVGRLLQSPACTPADRERLVSDATRLAHPDQMGGIYKAMALVAAARVPVGNPPLPTASSGLPPRDPSVVGVVSSAGEYTEGAGEGRFLAPPAFEGAPVAWAGEPRQHQLQ